MPNPYGVSNLEEGREVLASLPCLPERVKDFLDTLIAEPCQNDGGCIIMSMTSRMCAPCRIRMHFFHSIFNAEAYRPALAGLDDIQEFEGKTYIWVGEGDGDCSIHDDNSKGWVERKDHMVCVQRRHHKLRISDKGCLYCVDCGAAHLTMRDAFATEEEFSKALAEARDKADEFSSCHGVG